MMHDALKYITTTSSHAYMNPYPRPAPDPKLTPMFENPRDVTIIGSTLIDSGSMIGGMEILREYVNLGATHDSDERYDPPKCLPDTRIAILEMIERWAEGAGEPILWLTGPAGAGKSSIAQTICEHLKEKGFLGASFFFSRITAGRNNRLHLLPTIVYQLAMSSPTIRSYMERAISRDPLIFEKSLADQFRYLLIVPLEAALAQAGRSSTIVIVIDGLDECSLPYKTQGYEDQQKQILELVALVTQQDLSIRFLITSRPERQIRESFASPVLEQSTFPLVLDGNSQSLADIRRFLDVGFADIRRRNPSIDPAWPTPESLNQLVSKSSGYFVYPSTVVRHLSSPRIDPEEALKQILGLYISTEQHRHPLAQLDALYVHILTSVDQHSRENAHVILLLLMFDVKESIAKRTPEHFAELLCSTRTQVYNDLADLHSILDVPPPGTTPPRIIRPIHASFSDFLRDPDRSGAFWAYTPPSMRVQIRILDYVQKSSPSFLPDNAVALVHFLLDREAMWILDHEEGGKFAPLILRPGLILWMLLQYILISNLQEIVASPFNWWMRSSLRNLKFLLQSFWMTVRAWRTGFENRNTSGLLKGTVGVLFLLLLLELLHLRVIGALRISIYVIECAIFLFAGYLPLLPQSILLGLCFGLHLASTILFYLHVLPAVFVLRAAVDYYLDRIQG